MEASSCAARASTGMQACVKYKEAASRGRLSNLRELLREQSLLYMTGKRGLEGLLVYDWHCTFLTCERCIRHDRAGVPSVFHLEFSLTATLRAPICCRIDVNHVASRAILRETAPVIP